MFSTANQQHIVGQRPAIVSAAREGVVVSVRWFGQRSLLSQLKESRLHWPQPPPAFTQSNNTLLSMPGRRLDASGIVTDDI